MTKNIKFLSDCCYCFYHQDNKRGQDIDRIIPHLSALGYNVEELTAIKDSPSGVKYIVATQTGDCQVVENESKYPQSEKTYIVDSNSLTEFLTVSAAREDSVTNQYFTNGLGQWWNYNCGNPNYLDAAKRMGFHKATIEDFKYLFQHHRPWEVSAILYQSQERMTGRTTRLVDDFVQVLFDKAGTWVHISDHHHSRTGNDNILVKLIERMKREHNITLDVNRQRMEVRINPKDINFLC